MRYFDLHCDTITRCLEEDLPLWGSGLHVDLEKVGVFSHYVQCYAVWLPDELRGEAAYSYFCRAAQRLSQEAQAHQDAMALCASPEDLERAQAQGLHGAILTVESAAALGGDLSHVKDLKDRGVAMCTLTWNGANEVGRGVGAPGKEGLTPFGRQAVQAMEEAGIVVDLSHASPELFWEVADLAKKPIVASHSNAKAVCSHRRNLTEEQFQAIKKSGGLVGLNLHRWFLNDDPEKACLEDALRHAEYFLSLGGEDVLALGGDFDGSQPPEDLQGLEALPSLYERFLQANYPEDLVDRIFYGNAARFFAQARSL